jgi:hypothetical protein
MSENQKALSAEQSLPPRTELSAPHKFKVSASGSVECPHCHWGFAPTVILEHIHEKH